MEKFEKFYIEKATFDANTLVANFYYSFDKQVFFQEQIDFYSPDFSVRKEMEQEQISNILFHLSIAISISYYKLYPTREIIIENGFLDEQDLVFWHTFFLNGLGEFFYKNAINPEWLFQISASWKKQEDIKRLLNFELSEKYLLPVWWGKDSIVSSIILQESGYEYTNFIFGKIDHIKQSIIDQDWPKTLLVKRKLSDTLFELNSQGYYNGHIPITGIISFVMTFVCYLYDYKYIVFSNEKSADEQNVFIWNVKVNHQYSKSLEFENDFRKYICKNISTNIEYFSILRGFYELKIAQIFASKAKKYFPIFSSCNNNFKVHQTWNEKWKIWCNTCPKCLFVYMILRPFLKWEEVINIWWKELYTDSSLKQLFSELIDQKQNKPFECVGEKDESFFAAYLGLKKFDLEVPFLLRYFETNFLQKNEYADIHTLEEKYLWFDKAHNNIPQHLIEKIQKYV